MTSKLRVSKNDRQATQTVLTWVRKAKLNAEKAVIRDPDLALVAIPYDVPGMGTKVATRRHGVLVAWFDSSTAAWDAIKKAELA